MEGERVENLRTMLEACSETWKTHLAKVHKQLQEAHKTQVMAAKKLAEERQAAEIKSQRNNVAIEDLTKVTSTEEETVMSKNELAERRKALDNELNTKERYEDISATSGLCVEEDEHSMAYLEQALHEVQKEVVIPALTMKEFLDIGTGEND